MDISINWVRALASTVEGTAEELAAEIGVGGVYVRQHQHSWDTNSWTFGHIWSVAFDCINAANPTIDNTDVSACTSVPVAISIDSVAFSSMALSSSRADRRRLRSVTLPSSPCDRTTRTSSWRRSSAITWP